MSFIFLWFFFLFSSFFSSFFLLSLFSFSLFLFLFFLFHLFLFLSFFLSLFIYLVFFLSLSIFHSLFFTFYFLLFSFSLYFFFLCLFIPFFLTSFPSFFFLFSFFLSFFFLSFCLFVFFLFFFYILSFLLFLSLFFFHPFPFFPFFFSFLFSREHLLYGFIPLPRKLDLTQGYFIIEGVPRTNRYLRMAVTKVFDSPGISHFGAPQGSSDKFSSAKQVLPLRKAPPGPGDQHTQARTLVEPSSAEASTVLHISKHTVLFFLIIKSYFSSKPKIRRFYYQWNIILRKRIC